MPDEGSRNNAGLLRLPRRALGSLEDDESHRKRVRDSSAEDGANERFVVVHDRQADGIQAGHHRLEDLAPAERRESGAEGYRGCQIPRRHRGHRCPGKPRRLIASSPKILHSSTAILHYTIYYEDTMRRVNI